jgi:hypothetical protein
VLGKVAGGEEILKSITDIGRIAVAAQMLGLSQVPQYSSWTRC